MQEVRKCEKVERRIEKKGKVYERVQCASQKNVFEFSIAIFVFSNKSRGRSQPGGRGLNEVGKMGRKSRCES
jgi:hypothetical protein